jgi:hypothetical protein
MFTVNHMPLSCTWFGAVYLRSRQDAVQDRVNMTFGVLWLVLHNMLLVLLLLQNRQA